MKDYLSILFEKAQTRIAGVRAFSINESATDRYIDRLICENLPRELKPYANTPVKDLIANGVVEPQMLGMEPGDVEERGNDSFKDYIRLSICRDFDIVHGHGPKKYMRGIFRIVITELGYLASPDRNSIDNLKRYVMYIMDAAEHGTDQDAMNIDGDLNGMSYNMVRNKFEEKCANESALRKKTVSNKNISGKSDYTVEAITKHSQCTKYHPYTSWCIAFPSDTNYKGYTSGGNRFYIFTKNGYKTIQKTGGPDAPLDEYGLSMISILVNTTGDIKYITTRYNHEYNGEFFNPNAAIVQFFQDTIGMDLYEVCKPYTEEELLDVGVLTPSTVEKKLDQGIKYTVIFKGRRTWNTNYAKLRDDYILLYLDRSKFNILKDNKLIYDYWFDSFNTSNYRNHELEDFPVVRYQGKCNYLDANNGYELVSEDWLDNANLFHGGIAEITDNGETYYVNKNFDIVDTDGIDKVEGKSWHNPDSARHPNDDICVVTLTNGKQTYMDPSTGDFIFDKQFDSCYTFTGDVAMVGASTGHKNSYGYPEYKFNLIDIEGNLLLDKWMDCLEGYYLDRYAWVKCGLNGKYNLVNKEGEFISDTWYKMKLNYRDGMCLVPDDPDYVPRDDEYWSILKAPGVKFNYYNDDGEFVSDKWFDAAVYYWADSTVLLSYCLVELNNKYNYINKDGEYLFDEWFDDAQTLRRETKVTLNGKSNYFKGRTGEFISEKWFDYADDYFGPAFAVVGMKGKYNYIRRNGELLLDDWYDGLNDFHLGFAVIEKDGKFNYVDKEGNILSRTWFDKAKPFRKGVGIAYIGKTKYAVNRDGSVTHVR